MMMIHNPATIAVGNTKDMEAAISMLNEVKEAIFNAYVDKTGISRNKLSKLMDDETCFNARKAVELGFADKILFDKEEERTEKKNVEHLETNLEAVEVTEKTEDKEKEKISFQENSYVYSAKNVEASFLSKIKNEESSENKVQVEQLRKRLELLKYRGGIL